MALILESQINKVKTKLCKLSLLSSMKMWDNFDAWRKGSNLNHLFQCNHAMYRKEEKGRISATVKRQLIVGVENVVSSKIAQPSSYYRIWGEIQIDSTVKDTKKALNIRRMSCGDVELWMKMIDGMPEDSDWIKERGAVQSWQKKCFWQ